MVVIKKFENTIPVDFGEFELRFEVSDENILKLAELKDYAKELQEKLEKALRDVENDPKMKELFTKMFSITGFTDVDQDAYKKVEATAKVMNVDLDKVK